MSQLLPNRQNQVKGNFAYLALSPFCQSGKFELMDDANKPNRLKEVRETEGLTIEDVAERTGLSVSYVSRLENGERNLSVKNLNLFASVFNVDPSELLLPTKPRSNVVKVMGRIGAGAEISPEYEQLPPEGLFEIEVAFPLPDDAVAFEVAGESMWPRYDPGDVVVCWRGGTHIDEILGWEAAVVTATGNRYLKRVVRGSAPQTYDLESHNAPPIRGVKLKWVAEVHTVIRSGQWRKLNDDGRRRLLRKIKAA